MPEVQCFMIKRTERARFSLRRFVFQKDDECAGALGHDGTVPLGELPLRVDAKDYIEWVDPAEFQTDEYEWPTHCQHCGVPFGSLSVRVQEQVSQEPVYVADDGREMTLLDAPAGAMWDSTWYPNKGSDGMALTVKLPPAGPSDWWLVDGPASNSDSGWAREGTAPNITARPSIQSGSYHGFLTDGKLVEC